MRTDTKNQTHPACAALTVLASKIAAEAAKVREQYNSLSQITELMARTGAHHAEEAICEEARRRVLRNGWAAATSPVAA